MKKLVLNNTIRGLKTEKQLYACGWGGQGKDEIQMLCLSFFYYKPITNIDEGRDLLISAIHRFAQEIDKETRIHKHLWKYPFPPESLEIRIFRQTLDGSPDPLSSEELSVISFIDGVLEYNIDNPNGNGFIIVHTETYEEALAKWNGTQQQQYLESKKTEVANKVSM